MWVFLLLYTAGAGVLMLPLNSWTGNNDSTLFNTGIVLSTVSLNFEHNASVFRLFVVLFLSY